MKDKGIKKNSKLVGVIRCYWIPGNDDCTKQEYINWVVKIYGIPYEKVKRDLAAWEAGLA